MKIVKTVKCKLEVNDQERQALFETMDLFTQACNDAMKIARERNEWNRYKLHHFCYYGLRGQYPSLTANYIITAIGRVCAKRKRRPKSFRIGSLNLDKDLFYFIETKEMISLATTKGRLKIKLSLGNFQRGLLKEQKPTFANLVYKKPKKTFYINFVLKKEIPIPLGTNPIGIDRGIYNLATTSNGLKFSGREAMHIREHYAKLRQSLQAKGTKGAKRLLKRLSGRENRWMTNLNHNISKKIVDSCKEGDILVLEKLKDLRNQLRRTKIERRIHHSWAFRQLGDFIEYKALEKGVPVIYVDCQHTSEKCPKCNNIQSSNRKKHQFSCKICGYTQHADFVAAFNIAEAFRALNDGLSSTNP